MEYYSLKASADLLSKIKLDYCDKSRSCPGRFCSRLGSGLPGQQLLNEEASHARVLRNKNDFHSLNQFRCLDYVLQDKRLSPKEAT